MKIKCNTLWPIALAIIFSSAGCQMRSTSWQSVNLKNNLIELEVVPKIGGRIIQYKLGNHSFFYVNKPLYGIEPPPSRVGPNGEWLNYGGDKLWPAPQGWDNDQQWPGPPDPILDGGPYNAVVYREKNKPIGIKLTSLQDKRSGIQFSRRLTVFDNTTRVSVDVNMINIDTRNRRWGIWAVTQFDTSNRKGKGYNQNFWAFCPINPQSRFDKGYKVIFGPSDNSSFNPDYHKQMMQVQYQRRVGKIGLDASAGWIATLDASKGYVFVHRFTWEPGKPYPDDSSVEFWSNGVGEFTAWGKVNKMSPDPKENPYLLESEILSPFAEVKPGESYNFHYNWYTAKLPANSTVITCNDFGVICKPLSAQVLNDKLILDGVFGVFYKGTCQAVLLDNKNREITTLPAELSISPLKAFELSKTLSINDRTMLENAVSVALYLYDRTGKTIGELARTQIQKE